MMTIAKARAIGACLVIAAFASGAVAGFAFARRVEGGVRVVVTATDDIPRELTRLHLSDTQRAAVQQILRAGQERVGLVLDDFEPRLRTLADSTDQEIRRVLSDNQRAAFDSVRRTNTLFRRERKIR